VQSQRSDPFRLQISHEWLEGRKPKNDKTKQSSGRGGGMFSRALLTASLVVLLAAGGATRSRNRVSQPRSLRYSITNLIGDPFNPEFSLTPMRHRAGCRQQAKEMFARLLTAVLVTASASSQDAEASGEQTDSLHDLPVASTPAGALCAKSHLLQDPSPKQLRLLTPTTDSRDRGRTEDREFCQY